MIDLVIVNLLRYLNCLTKMRTVGQNPLMVELDDEDQGNKAQRRTNLWFSKVSIGV